MVETEKLPEGQRAWPISTFKQYSRVRRRLSQQPCTSRMVVSLGLCLLDCALAPAAGEWQSVDGYRFKALTVSTNEPVGFTSLPLDSSGSNFVNRLGSGYWSQDGLVQLFVVGDSKAKLHIRWADFSITTVPVPAGVKGIVISQTDGVKDVH